MQTRRRGAWTSTCSHGCSSLPFMMKGMVCYFVSDSHEVMTALIVMLPWIVVVQISLQLHRSFCLSFSLYVPLPLMNTSQPKFVSLLETMAEISIVHIVLLIEKKHFQEKFCTVEHVLFFCCNLISWSQFHCLKEICSLEEIMHLALLSSPLFWFVQSVHLRWKGRIGLKIGPPEGSSCWKCTGWGGETSAVSYVSACLYRLLGWES